MTKVHPFKIRIADSSLEDLNRRLKHTRWADTPDNKGWRYGTDPEYLKELVSYWLADYRWRQHEDHLNRFAQFTVEVDGITIHFVHIRGKGKNPKPLLLSHGWPDSFYRFTKVLPLLTEGAHTFDVVVPSIPGFGFSSHHALNSDRTAELFNRLMTEVLHYKTYYAAGGDLGTLITKSLAVQFPETVRAIHLTDVGYPDGSEDWSTLSPAEQEFGR